MSLDIYALRSPSFVKPYADLTDEDFDAGTPIHNEECFRAAGDGHAEGIYAGECVRHRGWSYGGYNRLREVICRAAFGVEPAVIWPRPGPWRNGEHGDLVSLIAFSDCEGAFGPVTSARIAAALRRLRLPAADALEWQCSVNDLAGCFEDAAAHKGFAVWR